MMIALIAMKLMETGLGPRVAKLASWAIVALLALLLVGAAVWWFTDTVDDARDEGVKTGATTERVEAQGKVIENVKTAKDAADAVRRDGPTRDECLQDSRIRENC
jgi:hypothetical protein